jgi:Nitronate monooxygenase
MPLSASLELTPLCRRLGLTAPVVQAPVGSATTPELAAAVSNAGGLGMLALTWTATGSVPDIIRATRPLTDRPSASTLSWSGHSTSAFRRAPRSPSRRRPPSGATQARTSTASTPAAPSTFTPSPPPRRLVAPSSGRLRRRGAGLGGRGSSIGRSGHVAARASRRRRGAAGTGHRGRRGGRRTFTTSGEIASETPQRAAPCTRASSMAAGRTRRTGRFATAPWSRGSGPDDPLPPASGRGRGVARAPDGASLYRYGAAIPVRWATGNVEALAHYAGQSAAIVEDVRPAATIVDELVRGAAAALGPPSCSTEPRGPPWGSTGCDRPRSCVWVVATARSGR